MKFEQHGPVASEKKFEIINFFFHTNVWGTYKAYRSKLDLTVKKVVSQCRTIILATLVDRPSLMICAKIQLQGVLGSGEDF